MSKVESIAQAFASYRQAVMPKDAPDVQVEEILPRPEGV
jgi:hypothetical protein